jgi:uncharacterized protein
MLTAKGMPAILLAICGVVALAVSPAGAALTFPRPTGYVNDFAHVLDPSTRTTLEGRLAEYDRTTGNEIAIATFAKLGGAPIEEFAVRLEEAWKVGKRGKDNGVLLLVAAQEHQIRIEVGYGLEGKITDADAGRIIREIMAPAFRQGRYGDGITGAVDALMRLITPGTGAATSTPETQPAPSTVPSGSPPWWLTLLGGPFLWFLAFIVVAMALGRGQRRRCPRCGARMALSEKQSLAFQPGLGPGTVQVWRCPRCGYQEKHLIRRGTGMMMPWIGGAGWGTGGFSGGGSSGGFGGFGGGASGGGGATGGW